MPLASASDMNLNILPPDWQCGHADETPDRNASTVGVTRPGRAEENRIQRRLSHPRNTRNDANISGG